MTEIRSCDGPECTVSIDLGRTVDRAALVANPDALRRTDRPARDWIHVTGARESIGRPLDFHQVECLAQWAQKHLERDQDRLRRLFGSTHTPDGTHGPARTLAEQLTADAEARARAEHPGDGV